MIRSSKKYYVWRNKIFKRDKNTCQKCKVTGGNLNVDHYPMFFAVIFKSLTDKENDLKKLLELALKDKRFWDIKNGRVLCKKCHYKTSNFAKKIIKKYKKYEKNN